MQSPVVVQYYSNWGRPSVGLPNSGVGHGTRYHGQEQGLHNNMHSHPGIPHGPEPHQLAASRLMGNTGHSHTNSIDSLHQHMSGTTTLSIPTPPSAGGSSTLIRCMWDNCQETFASMSELVGHVNLTHLRPQAQAHNGTNLTNMNGFIAEAQPQLEKQPAANTFSMNHLPLSCMWENCQTFPDLSGLLSLPAATSESSSTISDPVVTSESWDAAMQLLSSHLLHDHLGLVGGSTVGTAIALGPSKLVTASAMARLKSAGEGEQPQTTPSTPPEVITQDSPLIASTSSHSGTNSKPVSPFSHPIPTPSASPPPSPHHDCTTSQHICKWAPSNSATPCNASFATCALLTEHLTTEHVGTGKSSYECHWDGCSRKGEQGFGSKQKVLRHLQSHTGHRPFQCDVCGLWFSEAATLGQHMRRHTQESESRPTPCDISELIVM